MTSRERVQAAIDHKPIDRIPLDMTISYTAHNKLCDLMKWDHLRVETASIWSVAFPTPEFYEKMSLDCIYVGLKPPPGTPSIRFGVDQTFTNEFGQEYVKVVQSSGAIAYELTNAPAKDFTIEDLKNWKLPDPLDDAIFDGLVEKCKDLYENTDKALVGYFGASIFSAPSFIRGMEQWFVDMIEEPEFTHLFMKRFHDYYTKIYSKALDLVGKYLSFVRTDMDDFGSQFGSFISPHLFREQVKPYLKSFYDSIKAKFAEVNPLGRLMKHSCGDNSAFIDDYIEMGVDMLDPLQSRAGKMSREFLSGYKGRIAFRGNVDTQDVMPYGSPDDVRADVKDAIRHLASPSGYVCGPVHHILGDVPPENIVALRDAALLYGQVKDGKLVNLL
jgi:uroporphyrinogen decarboxylase